MGNNQENKRRTAINKEKERKNWEMKYFYSPLKLIELFKDRQAIVEAIKRQRDVDWYFSKEGEEAYKNAETPAQKTKYFFDYLLAVVKSNGKWARDIMLYKIAYIMANSMDSSSLEFAGYPNILDSAKNPLVNFVKTADYTYDKTVQRSAVTCSQMLAALHHEPDTDKYFVSEQEPYNNVTYCSPDGSVPDLYRIERDIIGVFSAEDDEPYWPPYKYDIVHDFNKILAERERG